MPSVKFELPMNNAVKPGQTTRDEVIASLQASGIPVQAANPVTDPVTGRLIRVEVHLPDAAADIATTKINANSGLACAAVAVPELLPLVKPSSSAGLALATAILKTGQYLKIGVLYAKGEGFTIQPYGTLSGDGEANTYTPVSPEPLMNPGAIGLGLEIINSHASEQLAIPGADVVITLADGQEFTSNIGETITLSAVNPSIGLPAYTLGLLFRKPGTDDEWIGYVLKAHNPGSLYSWNLDVGTDSPEVAAVRGGCNMAWVPPVLW